MAGRQAAPRASAARARVARGLRVAGLGGALLLGGCLDDELDPNRQPAASDSFIALQRDFASFRSWPRIEVAPADAPAVTGGHRSGPREVYLHGLASGGSFPVGTLIVKTAEIGAPQSWEIHARAVRGGGFNPQGAIGWEWFELQVTSNDDVIIVWRGEKPPANHGYESLPGLGSTSSTDGDCNSCHGAARTTDYILAPALQAMLAGS